MASRRREPIAKLTRCGISRERTVAGNNKKVDATITLSTPPSRLKMMIQVSKLEKRYGEHVILDKVSFSINAGERVGLVGRNGHGKTSFINSIKLLFSGSSEELRSGIPGSGKKITTKNYLLGFQDLWAGVFNRKARKERQQKFYIKIEWEEEAGRVESIREWVMTGDHECREHLKKPGLKTGG